MTPLPESRASRILPPVLFALALALAVKVIIDSFPATAREPNADVGFYLRYMQRVPGEGLSVFPALFDEWNASEASWIFPPPSRVGFIVASALWASIFGTTMQALQYLSIAAHLCCSIATYVFARRHFGDPRALFIAVLWLFAPLLMGLSRLALTDSFITLWMSLSAWTFLELVLQPASWRWRSAFAAVFAFTLLVKELSLLLGMPFAAFVLVERFWRREPLKLSVFAWALALPGAVALAICVVAAGGLPTLLTTTRIVLGSPATNAYAIRYGSGPWFSYVVDFLCLSPGTTLLAIAFLGVLILRWKNGAYGRRLVFLALIVVCLCIEYSLPTKNVRYAVLFHLPICVFAVCMLTEILRFASPSRSAILCAVAVALLCWFDGQYFQELWVRYHGYDPVTWILVGTRRMIPFPTGPHRRPAYARRMRRGVGAELVESSPPRFRHRGGVPAKRFPGNVTSGGLATRPGRARRCGRTRASWAIAHLEDLYGRARGRRFQPWR
jgi:hypothetical protein